MSAINTYFATAAKGLETLLAEELVAMGMTEVKEARAGVYFSGGIENAYRACLWSRVANRILLPLGRYPAATPEALYDGVSKIDWREHLSALDSFAVDASVSNSAITHSQYAALKTKDAIVDRFRDQTGERPNVDLRFPDLKIDIHIDRHFCTVSLDSSGESLHKRGYKIATNIAPINEVLAAGLIMLSGWDGQSDFMDPMCGSGTVLIEAAMIACNIPPNLMRNEFGFERWEDWDVDLFEKIEESLLSKTRDFHHKIMGFDKSPSAVEKAIQNVENAKLEDFIYIKHEDFFKTQKGGEEHLHMVFNPPYGERLDIEMESFYSSIGSTLKHKYPGTNAWMISSNMEALKHIGLRPSRKIKLFNAKLESRFSKYEMYAGTKKTHKLKTKTD